MNKEATKLSWSRRRSLRKCNKLSSIPEKPSDFVVPFYENRSIQGLNQMPVKVLPVPQRAVSLQNIASRRPLSAVNFHINAPNFSTTKTKSVSQYELNKNFYQQRHYNTRQSVKNANSIVVEITAKRRFEQEELDELQSPKKRNKSSLQGIRSRLQKTFGRRRSGFPFIDNPVIHEENNNCQRNNNFKLNSSPMHVPEKKATIFHNFHELLEHKSKCSEFRSFLAGEHSEENLDFWLDCEKYKKLTSSKERIKFGKFITKRYIDDTALKEINLTSATKQELRKNIAYSYNSFDKAQEEIYKLMQTDSYPRFLAAKLATAQQSIV